jgi:hypothetical protein
MPAWRVKGRISLLPPINVSNSAHAEIPFSVYFSKFLSPRSFLSVKAHFQLKQKHEEDYFPNEYLGTRRPELNIGILEYVLASPITPHHVKLLIW